jgi:hypothetical protein
MIEIITKHLVSTKNKNKNLTKYNELTFHTKSKFSSLAGSCLYRYLLLMVLVFSPTIPNKAYQKLKKHSHWLSTIDECTKYEEWMET